MIRLLMLSCCKVQLAIYGPSSEDGNFGRLSKVNGLPDHAHSAVEFTLNNVQMFES